MNVMCLIICSRFVHEYIVNFQLFCGIFVLESCSLSFSSYVVHCSLRLTHPWAQVISVVNGLASSHVYIVCSLILPWNLVKGNGNVNLYSASSRMPRSDMDHTVLPANNTISDFAHNHSPGGAIITHSEHLSSTYYSFINPKTMNGWVGSCWLTYSGQFTPEEVTRQLHVMAPARQSSPVIVRRSNHCATPPTLSLV